MYHTKVIQKIRGIFNKLLQKLIYRLFLLFLIPLVLLSMSNFFTYQYYMRYFEKEARQTSMTSLSTISETMHRMYYEIFQTNKLLYIDQNLIDILTESDSKLISNHDKIFNCYNSLLLLRYTKNMIDNIYIFNRNVDFIVSTLGTGNSNDFFTQNYRYDIYSKNFWQNLSVKHYEFKILKPSTVTLSSNNAPISKNVIPIVQAGIGQLNTKSLFVTNINEIDLFKIIEKNKITPNSTIMVMDSEGNIYSSTDRKSSPDKLKSSYFLSKYSSSTSGTYYDTINSEKCLVIVHKSSILSNNFVYIAYVPFKDLYTKISYIQRVGLAVIIAGLLLSVLLSTLFARKVYSPINHLISAMKKNQGEDSSISVNSDLYYIENSYQNAIDRFNNLSVNFSRVLPMAFEQYMIKVLNSNDMFFDEQFTDFLQKSRFVFKHPNFCAAAVQLNFTKKFYEKYTKEEQLFIFNGIINLVNSTFSEDIPVFTLTTEINQLYIIMNVPENESIQYIETCLIGFYNAFEFDKEYHQIYIGIGLIHKDLNGLCRSYKQAVRAIAMLSPFSSSKVKIYSETTINDGYIYNNEDENQLFNYLISGQKAKMEALLKSILQKNAESGITDLCIRELYYQIYLTGIKVLKNKGIPPSELMGNEYINFISEYSLIPLNQTIGYIAEFFKRIVELSRNNRPEKINLEEIKDYILTNYYKDIYLEQIAENYKTSLAHLSRYIKKEFGMTFSDYLAKVRIQKAKELLATTGKNINEISTSVGFNSRNTFIRMFKKLEGITPSDYRNSIR